MQIALKRGNDIIRNIEPQESSQLSRKLNGEDVVKLNFTVPDAIELQIGDYIEVFDKKYTLNLPSNFVKKSTLEHSYECIFEGPLYDLRKPQFMNGISSEFFLNGDLSFFVSQIVTNLNRIFTGWTVGTVDASSTKNLQFSNENCLVVLQRLCTEFNVDFRIDDKTISVGTFSQTAVHSFAYGKGKGLYQLTRKVVDSKDIITRLYPYGSTRNIPGNYRNYSPRLTIADGYIEKNVDIYGIIEASINFDDIYPRFTGAITSVIDEKTFRCTAINFDVNAQLMPGTSCKVHFNTGALAGYEFEMVSYNATTKEIVLKLLDQEKSVNNAGTLEPYILPNATIKPAIGDSFVFIDIIMPQTYIDAAEAELLVKSQEYLDQNCEPRVVYGMDIDPIFMKQTGIILDVGIYVNVNDEPFGIDKDTRITTLTRSLSNEYMWKVDLADQLSPQRIDRAVADLEEIKRLVVINRLDDIPRAYRSWKNSNELLASIFDPDGYFDSTKIKPLSIETTMLAVGGKSVQFTTNCLIEANYGGNANSCKLGAGILAHLAIEETPRTWTISQNIVNSLTSGSFYYIYAKCIRSSANTGQFVLDTLQRKVDSDATYYYFLVGVLHSVVEGVRGISLTYGQALINGKFIKGILTSDDGLSFLNVNTGEYVGKITFRSGKTDSQIESEISSAQSDANYAQMVADAAITNAAQAQADASTALASITGVISDNVLSAIEKSGERLRWNTSLTEKNGIDIQATIFGITSEKTAYDNAFQALGNYLNAGVTWTDGAPLWIADANLTTNTAIVGSTYRTTWETFLNAKTALLNAIAAKAKELADAAQADANYASTVADSALTNAINAQNAATNAQNAANNAVTKANIVNALVTDMANDDLITPSEKTALKKEFDSIESEVPKNDDQADTFEVSRTAYDNAFIALNSYIGNNLNVLSDTWDLGTGGGAELRSYFKTYTDARTDLLNAIAFKAKQLADAAKLEAYYASLVADSALQRGDEAYYLADQKKRTFIYVPTTPYSVGDSWENGIDRLTCVTPRASGAFNPNDWAKLVNYDSTQVSINNGIVSAGSFRVKDSNDVEWGGMRGATGTDGTELFIWGGASMVNRDAANFKVTHNGDLYAGSATIKSNGTFDGDVRASAQLYNGLLELGYEFGETHMFAKTIKLDGENHLIEIAPFEPGDSSFYKDMAIKKGNLNVLTWDWSLTEGAYILKSGLDVSFGKLKLTSLPNVNGQSGFSHMVINPSSGQIGYI